MGARGPKPGTKATSTRKGIPNKRTVEVQEKLEKLGCDPLAGMARLAEHSERDAREKMAATIQRMIEAATTLHGLEGKDLEAFIDLVERSLSNDAAAIDRAHSLAGQMYKELAQYVAPKRKAVEHSTPGDKPLPIFQVVGVGTNSEN